MDEELVPCQESLVFANEMVHTIHVLLGRENAEVRPGFGYGILALGVGNVDRFSRSWTSQAVVREARISFQHWTQTAAGKLSGLW